MLYITIEQDLFQETCDEFFSATSVEEALRLVEAGFDHVCDFDAVKLIRKRK